MDFTILNWNIGGAKYLEKKEAEREQFRRELNNQLKALIEERSPHVVTLQEIVRYGHTQENRNELIDPIDGYCYYSFPLIDTHRLSSEAKWDKVRKLGGWARSAYFAQGNAVLIREKGVGHCCVWELPKKPISPNPDRHYIEQVNFESGLYFGDRNTEARAALVTHLVFHPKELRKPLDIFVVNLHLTTLMMEREGIPEIDSEAARIRQAQLSIVFDGIVSRYNVWRQRGYPRARRAPQTETDGDLRSVPTGMDTDRRLQLHPGINRI